MCVSKIPIFEDTLEWNMETYESSDNLLDYFKYLFNKPNIDIYDIVMTKRVTKLIQTDTKHLFSFQKVINQEYEKFIKRIPNHTYPKYEFTLANNTLSFIRYGFYTIIDGLTDGITPIKYNIINAAIIWSTPLFKYLIMTDSFNENLTENDKNEMMITAFLARNYEVIHILESKYEIPYERIYSYLVLLLICNMIKFLTILYYIPSMRNDACLVLTDFVNLFDHLILNSNVRTKPLSHQVAPISDYDDISSLIHDYSVVLRNVLSVEPLQYINNHAILFETCSLFYPFMLISNDSFYLVDALLSNVKQIISDLLRNFLYKTIFDNYKNMPIKQIIYAIVSDNEISHFINKNTEILELLIFRYKQIGITLENVRDFVLKYFQQDDIDVYKGSEIAVIVSRVKLLKDDEEITEILNSTMGNFMKKIEEIENYSMRIYILSNLIETNTMISLKAQTYLNDMLKNNLSFKKYEDS